MESVLRFQALWESVLTVTTGLLSHYCVPAAAPGTGMEHTQPCPCSQSVSSSVNKQMVPGGATGSEDESSGGEGLCGL